ncbi:MAG: hypothetical protein ACXVCP_04235 [Bdellovibrio sp.]
MKQLVTFIGILGFYLTATAETTIVQNTGGSSYEKAGHLWGKGCIESVVFIKGVPSASNNGGKEPLSKVNFKNCEQEDTLDGITMIFTGTDVINGLAYSGAIGKHVLLQSEGNGVIVLSVK